MTPEEERVARFREQHADTYAGVLDTADGRRRVYGAAMCALAFTASEEGFGRFRRWLTERPSEGAQFASDWTPQALCAAARVLAAWTILDHEQSQHGGG